MSAHSMMAFLTLVSPIAVYSVSGVLLVNFYENATLNSCKADIMVWLLVASDKYIIDGYPCMLILFNYKLTSNQLCRVTVGETQIQLKMASFNTLYGNAWLDCEVIEVLSK